MWSRLRDFITGDATPQLDKDMLRGEYELTLYATQRANNLQQLIDARNRIREFHQRLIESRLEYWGRTYIRILNAHWSAKYKSWKDKVRNR
jgi:nicotinamide riboside kinase